MRNERFMGLRLRGHGPPYISRRADSVSSSRVISPSTGRRRIQDYAGGMPGHWELIALGIVILLLFGSKQLPAIARNLGRGVREVRETVADVDPRKELRQLEAGKPEAAAGDERRAEPS